MIKNSFRAQRLHRPSRGSPMHRYSVWWKWPSKHLVFQHVHFQKAWKLNVFITYFCFFRKCWKTLWFSSHFNEQIWKHVVFQLSFRKCLKTQWFWYSWFQKAWKHYSFQFVLWKCIKMMPRRFDLKLCGLGSTSRQNELQKVRFDAFWPWLQKSTKWVPEGSIWGIPALAPEVDKMRSRRVDLSIFRPWLQKSTKWAPEGSIWGTPALAPEVDKMSSRSSIWTFSGQCR